MSRSTLTVIVSAILACLSAVAIGRMPSRSVDTRRADAADLERAPEGDTFRIGGILWDLRTFAREPRLEPFRALLKERCPDLVGLNAAVCLSDLFAATFPHGMPTDDSFDRAYDPVKDLDAHLRGAPGNCVTRSALISTALLASGIPARQVQYIAAGWGHTAMEVWDGARWVFFDPTFGTVFSDKGGTLPAAAAVLRAEGALVQLAKSPSQTLVNPLRRAARATLRYPEPWLYTRVGERYAAWPFRSRNEEVGAFLWTMGAAQPLARAGLVFFSAVAAYSAIRLRRRTKAVSEVPTPAFGREEQAASAEAA